MTLLYSEPSSIEGAYRVEAVLAKLTRDLRRNAKLNFAIKALFCYLSRVSRYSMIVALSALWLSALWLGTASPAYADTLITNTRIIDGTGTPALTGSVRLSGDRITAVGELTPNDSDTVIDAGGLVLAPGFIFLGFAVGAMIVGGLLLLGGGLVPSFPIALLIAGISAGVAWVFIRKLAGERKGQVKRIDTDINEN